MRANDTVATPTPSFTVSTVDQVKSASYRRSFAAYEELQADNTEKIGARVLLKWTGIGIVAGLGVLAALIFVLGFSDKPPAFGNSNARATMKIDQPASAAAPPPPAVTQLPAPQKPAEPPQTVAPAPPAKRAVTTTAKTLKKKR
jgi:hypothetical protein